MGPYGLLSWNMGFNGRPSDVVASARIAVLQSLVEERGPSLVVLQEAPDDVDSAFTDDYEVVRGPVSLVTGYRRRFWQRVDHREPIPRGLVVSLDSDSGCRLWLWNLHLKALWVTPVEKQEYVRNDLRPALEAVRCVDPGRSEIIAGDFNLSPFDDAIQLASGLNANRCLEWVRAAMYSDIQKRRLFNASWRVLGRTGPPLGSLYRSCVDDGGPWYLYDQALLSADLVEADSVQVDIVDRCGAGELCTRSSYRAPKSNVGSDHLPIFVSFSSGHGRGNDMPEDG